MENKLKELKPYETQAEYEAALGNRDFVRDTINFAKNRILKMTEEIASEWKYVHNYEKILADLDVAILRWEIEQEVKKKRITK